MPALRYQAISFIQAGLNMSFACDSLCMLHFGFVSIQSSCLRLLSSQVLSLIRGDKHPAYRPLPARQHWFCETSQFIVGYFTWKSLRLDFAEDRISVHHPTLPACHRTEAPARPGATHVVDSLPHSCSFAATFAAQSETSRLATASCDTGDSTMRAEDSTHVY